MTGNAHRIGRDRQGWIDSCRRRKARAVDDPEVVDFMHAALEVEYTRRGVRTHHRRTALMRIGRDTHSLGQDHGVA